jgi:hypothetical protein
MKRITRVSEPKRRALPVAAGIVAVLMLLLPAFGAPLIAQGIATVRPEPATLELGPGEVADVTIVLENAQNVYGIDVSAAFDPAIVEIVDADPATDGVQMFVGAFPQPDFVALNTADNAAGTLRYVVTQVNPTPPATGAGVVFSFQVRARAGGAGELAIPLVEMSDRDGNLLAVNTGSATIQVTGPTAAPTGIVLQPTAGVTGEAGVTEAPTATSATATAAPPGSGATSAPPAAATATIAGAAPAASPAAGETAAAGGGAPGENPTAIAQVIATAAPIGAAESTAAPGNSAGPAGASPAAESATATAPAGAAPVIIGETSGAQTALDAALPSSAPARGNLAIVAVLLAIIALAAAVIVVARLSKRE